MTADDVARALPRLVKDAIQRAGHRLPAFIEAFTDETGPDRYPSPSSRWGTQSGRLMRSFLPGQAENIFKIEETRGHATVTYASRLGDPGHDRPYLLFLERGTRYMRARPSFEPGLKKFEAEEWPRLVDDILKSLAEEFNT